MGNKIRKDGKKSLTANQWAKELSPQQKLFLEYFLNPQSDTFSNAYKSALKAGFSDSYAKVITRDKSIWMSERVSDELMVREAERQLYKKLVSRDEKVSLDASKFVTSRLAKRKWSERTELTGAEGKPIIQVASEIANKYKIKATESKE